MATAFDIMFPEGSRGLALLHDLSKNPEDFGRFLESVPKDYRPLFAKVRAQQRPERPPIPDVTFMELTGFYVPKVNKKLAPFNFSIKLFTTDGTEFDLSEPAWSSISYVTTANRLKGWQSRNKASAQTVDDMQALFDAGFNFVAPMTQMAGGRSRDGSYFAANITGKVIHSAMVIFPDHVLSIPQGSFIYQEANGPFKNSEVFARYRFSRLSNRPSWASKEEWVAR
jgi:hypothetical protein